MEQRMRDFENLLNDKVTEMKKLYFDGKEVASSMIALNGIKRKRTFFRGKMLKKVREVAVERISPFSP
jgi:hypothetical protein